MICLWSTDNFDKLPNRIVRDISDALEHSFGERVLSDVFDDLALGHKQLWVNDCNGEFTTTVVTQIITYPKKKTLEICYLGGLDTLNQLSEIKIIEEWARIEGCKDIQVIGRKGWLRALKDEGYQERYTTIGKEL